MAKSQLDSAMFSARIAFLDYTMCDRCVGRQALRFATPAGDIGYLEMYSPSEAEITIDVYGVGVVRYFGRRSSKQGSELREWGWFTTRAWDALSLVWGTRPAVNRLIDVNFDGDVILCEREAEAKKTNTVLTAINKVRDAARFLRDLPVDDRFHSLEVEAFLFGRVRYLTVSRNPNSKLIYLNNASRSETIFEDTGLAQTLLTLFKGW